MVKELIGDNPFDIDGHWFRGNTHCHTTRSDGLRSPEDAVQWYREAKYDFLVITDHNIAVNTDELTSGSLLVIPGNEVHSVDPYIGPYHLVAIGTNEDLEPYNTEKRDLQELINQIKEQEALSILAHPYYMGLHSLNVATLSGLTGIEVFNTTCELFNGKGISDYFWNELLSIGMCVWGLAADDTHWKLSRDDAGGGWIMVRAETISQDSILKAIASGHFWATTGPVIKDVRMNAGIVTVECSPVVRINFLGQPLRFGHTHLAHPETTVTEASYQPEASEKFLRIEIINEKGNRAWSNPFFFG